MVPANEAKIEQSEGVLHGRSIDDLAALVRLHHKTLEMNGDNASDVLKKAAADAVAEYEAAVSLRAG